MHITQNDIRKLQTIQKIFESLGRTIRGATISYEGNNAAIHKIQAGQLTPRIKHLDMMMTWLHEQH